MSLLKGTSLAGFSFLIVCAVKITTYVTFRTVSDGIQRHWYLENILPSYAASGRK
jgi:hypothetical protein